MPQVADSAWGIDVGRFALKALRLAYDPTIERAVALSFDVVEYPEVLRLDHWSAQPILTAALARVLERNDFEGSRIAVAAAGRAGLIKTSRLPQTSGKRLRDLMAYEARLLIPVALNEVVWDYQVLDAAPEPEPEIPLAEVGLFALTRQAIDQTLIPLQNNEITPDVIQLEPVSLVNFAVFDQAADEGHEVLALMDVGARGTDLVILFGQRFWRQVIPFGGNHFTQAMVAELGIGFDNAEQVKCNFGKSRDPQAALRAMAGAYDALIEKAERYVRHFASLHGGVKIARTLLLGSGAHVPGLAELLPRRFGKVERLDHFGKLVGDDVLLAPKFRAHAGSFAVAYGLGLQALGLGRWQTNLLPPELRPRRGWSLGHLLERFRGVLPGR